MVTNNYTPYAGGVVHAIQTYTQELQRQGHTVYIITLDFGVSDDPWYVMRVPSCFRCRFRGNILSLPWRMSEYVAYYIDVCNPDIVHIHSPFVLGEAGLQAAHNRNIPTVFTYHSLYERFVTYFPLPQHFMQQLILKRVHAFCRKVDAIIAPSRYIMHRLQHIVARDTLWHLPTPIRKTFFRDRQSVITKRPSRYIICVGRFQPEKQIDNVIDAFARIRKMLDVTLVLIGFGASYNFLRWYAYTYYGFSQDVVQFVIRPGLDELISWYQAADVFVSASPEAQGLVFAESCASGVPIVAYRAGGAADIVTDGENGFLVDDPECMAACVVAIYRDVTVWRQMVCSAFDVAQQYHPCRQATQMLELYQRVRETNWRGGPLQKEDHF